MPTPLQARKFLLAAVVVVVVCGPCFAGGVGSSSAQNNEPDLIFTGSILRSVSRTVSVVEAAPDSKLRRENLASEPSRRFQAFTVADSARNEVEFIDRIFVKDFRTRRTFEIRGLPDPHRPYNDLIFKGGTLQFDRWSNPHYGVRYLFDVRRRRLISARSFAEADYVEFLKKSEPSQTSRVEAVGNEPLRQELLRMVEADQAARAPLMEGRQLSEAETREMQARDAANTKRLLEIFKEQGFPGVALVGSDGTQAVVTMLLHSSSLELQRRALPHVKRAARRGEIPIDAFAMLTDDVLANEGKPQLYGTNFKFVDGKLALDETKDPAHLDARRRKAGLPPIREYAKLLAEMYKMPLDEASFPPASKR